MFEKTLDRKAKGWFDKLSPRSIDSWGELQRKFLNRFGILRACVKDPTDILRFHQRANGSLKTFEERWISETSYIPDVPEVM